MAPPQKVVQALNAMKAIGIPVQRAKPVLRDLLKVYENNWELIEEENYRVLADAIFETDDTKEEELVKKKTERSEAKKKEIANDQPAERPRRRLRLAADDGDEPSPMIEKNVASSSKKPRLESFASTQICTVTESGCQEVLSEEGTQHHLPQTGSNIMDPGEEMPVSSPTSCGRNGVDDLPLITRRREKGPIASKNVSKAQSPAPERMENPTYLKIPKLEPGIAHLPNCAPAQHYLDLVKPKVEMSDELTPSFEVPLAMIHPSDPGPLGNEDDSIQQPDACKDRQSDYVDHREEEPVQDVTKKGNNLGVAGDAALAANVDIVSSASGEVKLSLICDSVHERSDFHMPSLDDVLKLVEDKCLRSYKIIDQNFSLKNIMKEICNSFFELGSNSTTDKQDASIEVIPQLDVLKKSHMQSILGAKDDHFSGHVNNNVVSPPGGSHSNFHYSSGNDLTSTPFSIKGLNGIQHDMPPSQSVSGNNGNGEDKNNKGFENSKTVDCSPHSLVVYQGKQIGFDDARPNHDVNDITKGEERVCISVVNEVTSERCPPSFYYIPRNMIYQHGYVNFSLARIGDEDCCSDCFGNCMSVSIPCACARETWGEYAYTPDGLVKEKFLDGSISQNRNPEKHSLFYCKVCPLERSKSEAMPDSCKGHIVRKFIKECWSKCGCSKECGNRVVQRGITRSLQVFYTSEGKGWGLRTLEEIPRGAFVCEYVGEILTNMELYDRTIQTTGNARHTYPVLLDADWGSEGVLKDEEALCLDATFYGNVARFVNHRCFDANLIEIPVEVETPDHHYYHLAFFTTRKIEPMEELTWDYGIDFDDHDHPVKAFRCLCGSKGCRDLKHPKRSKANLPSMRKSNGKV
ncbi:Histone-lysine N-methyltransferase SUVR4 [Acorus gramineus]|uniref:Histone-lysine N-methyltransferase SUVR4 n=1 Tax=Acorus gramineus TaxID=55184 RepID=A0AAV9A8X2_ACOGR|nr:Histone-lysine N-methyltransferase SUVR4 [Acorus gramineus]